MKQGTTTTFKINIPKIENIDYVSEIIFSFSDSYKIKEDKSNVLMTKSYPEDVSYTDGTFSIGLTQEETEDLPTTFYIEGQVEFVDKSVVKTDTERYIMSQTVNTTLVDGNTPSGNDDVDLEMNVSDVIELTIVSGDYNDLENKPSINGTTLSGDKSASDLNLVDSTEFDSLAEQVSSQGEDIGILDTDVADLKSGKADKTALTQEVLNRASADDILDGKIENVKISFGNGIEASVNPTTYVCTFNLKNGNTVLSTATIDLPLESVVVSGAYDSTTKEVVLTLQNGSTVRFSVADLVSGLVSETTFNSAIASINASLDLKADKSTTYTKTEVDTALADKQNKLNASYGITLNSPTNEIGVDTDVIADKEYVDNEIAEIPLPRPITDTAKGNAITLTDSTDEPINAISIMGKSTQVKTNGYQLAEWMVKGNTYTYSGITFTYLGKGRIKVEGTNTANFNTTLTLLDDTGGRIPRGQYIYQAKGVSANCIVGAYNGGSLSQDGTKVVNATTDGTAYTFYIRVQAGATVDTVVETQFESGTVAHDCEDYTGGLPTPRIDYPQTITDITSEQITVTDGTATQTANLDIVLRGIPVSSGGNYTDNNNQQWLCDSIERYADGTGKLIRRIYHKVFNGSENWVYQDNQTYQRLNVALESSVLDSRANNPRSMLNLAPLGATDTNNFNHYLVAGSVIYINPSTNGTACMTKAEWQSFLASNNMTVIACLNEPTETPLTAEQLAELDLSTYYPTTNINSNADVVVEYVCDTKNYIDKKTSALQSAILSLGGNI